MRTDAVNCANTIGRARPPCGWREMLKRARGPATKAKMGAMNLAGAEFSPEPAHTPPRLFADDRSVISIVE